MTEYDRGPGSQPWHPEDPLYGDRGWGGHQAVTGQDPYAQDSYARDSYAQDPYGQGAYDQDPYGQGSYGQDLYGQDPYGHQQYPHGYTQDPQHHQQPQQWNDQGGGYPQAPRQDYAGGGWDGSYGGMDPHDPYDPYGGGQAGQGTQDGYYAAQDGYPRQQPQQRQQPHVPRQAQAPQETQSMPQVSEAPHGHRESAAQESEEEDHPFFLDGEGRRAAPDDDEEDDLGDERRGKQGKKPKRRSGVACLFVSVALIGVVGGGGYFAYDFWQTRFGPAPDYSGEGSGQVTVEIPEGTGGAAIGDILTDKGVVKSSGAFVEAVNDSGKVIQPGTYTLRKQMSGAAAVKLMTDGTSSNALIVTEGMRDTAVYAAIDKKIGLKPGTTAGVARKEAKNLGLPSWADDSPKVKDPLEGFLYPSRYSVGGDAKPKDVLRKMVALANQNYAEQDLEGKAEELGLKSPLQLLTVASLVQAEGITHEDFRKMSEVVYNRLEPGNTQTNGKLEFDSTYNYIKNQSKIDIPINEIKKYDNPYNTYFYAGLPPGPIGNPGEDALKAAMNPTDEGWFYFISLDGRTSQFSKTYAEHQKWVEKFNKQRKNNG